MTSTTERLGKIRKEFLSLLKNPDVSVEQLRGFLDQEKQHIPELLSYFQQDEANPLSDNKVSDWSAEYFSRHVLLAEHNFSYERIEHLIKVREHLQKKGVKGFVSSLRPPFAAQKKSPHNMASNYTPSDNLYKFVTSGDLFNKRTALHMELHRNSLTSDDLRAALAWTKERVPDLFESYSEKAFARGMERDRQLWDSQYYANQDVYFQTNFSEERFLHLIEVRDLLRQQGVEGFAARPAQPRDSIRKTSPPADSAQPRNGQSHLGGDSLSQPEHNPAFKTALMVGGAVAALAILLIALMK